MTNGLKAFATLKQVLTETGWNIHPVENYHAYKAEHTSASRLLTCYFEIETELEQFIFYASPEFVVPVDKRSIVAEYVARVNSGLRIGNLEIDFRDGHVRFKSSVNFANEILTPGLIVNAIQPILETTDIYLPGLINVMNELETPIRAINAIEYKD